MQQRGDRMEFRAASSDAARAARERRRLAEIEERKERERSAALDEKWQRLLSKALRS